MLQKRTLENGLRVVLTPRKETRALAIFLGMKAGSEYEKKTERGISHFLEHMVFKGTQRRPSNQEITGPIEGVGGSIDVVTEKELVNYLVVVPASDKNMDLSLDILSDMVINPRLEKNEIDKERKVIGEEINFRKDVPAWLVAEIGERLLYGDQPAGWPTIGTAETINKINEIHLSQFLKQNYTADFAVISVCGYFDPDRVYSSIENWFKQMPKAGEKQKLNVSEHQTGPQSEVQYKETQQTHLFLSWRAFPLYHPDRYALTLLEAILGRGQSSRLFLKLREEANLAYAFDVHLDLCTHRGYLAVCAGIENESVPQGISIILEECQK